jgi:alpha-beta hydrolase superfamily lysophospholipase
MQETSFTLDAADGTGIHVWHWVPDEGRTVRGVVQIAHGLAEHAERYRATAQRLTDANWAVVADDHRGHGRTAASDDDLGYFADERGWVWVLDDLWRLTARARELHPDVPVVLLGHSMGSFLAQQYLFTFPGDVDAAVLSGSNGPLGPLVEVGSLLSGIERRRLGPHGRSPLLHALAFGAYNKPFEPARTEFDWLSRDEAQVDAYVADPRCGFVATTKLWSDFFGGLRVIQQSHRLAPIPSDLPVYVFSGEVDPVGGADGVASLVDHYEQAGLTNVTSRVYPDGRHEMLNEVNTDEVHDDLLAWLDHAVPDPTASDA